MRVNFEVPDRVWARLLDVAEEHHTTAASVLSAAVVSITHQPTRMDVTHRRERVLRLVRDGFTDQQISVYTGELKNYVADTRRKAGLPANRPYPREEKTA